MFSVVQTNFNGIDGLEYQELPKPELTNDGVIVKMNTLPVTPTDLKKETNPNATDEKAEDLPRTIGMGGVGTVVAVGNNRDQALLNQRVFVISINGAYSEYVLSTNPDFIYPLPDEVNDASGASLLGGPGTSMVLKEEIDQSNAQNIVITGANSVIGQFLIQMLDHSNKTIWPIVSNSSKAYFQNQFPDLTSYTAEELPDLEDSLIIDIAGSKKLLSELIKHVGDKIISIVIMHTDKFDNLKFVHEEFSPKLYKQLIKQLASGELVAPIDRVFSIKATKEAQHYVADSHSRGRVLVEFK